MNKPTGKLLFAYQTIASLEAERDTLRTANQRLEGEVARLCKVLEKLARDETYTGDVARSALSTTANGEVT